uniref:GLPGLI family protein n=1 Tax=Gelidibacter sp. TaxID=2018083 RepID=UPI004049BCBE
MKKFFIILIIILAYSKNLFSQNYSGKAYYKSQTKEIQGINNDTVKMSAEKSEILSFVKGILKNNLEKDFVLEFNNNESLYFQDVKLSTPTPNSFNFGDFDANNDLVFKNLKTKEVVIKKEFLGKLFLIKDTLPNHNWVLTDEFKMIGKYNSRKAILNTSSLTQFDDEKENSSQIIAWYCTEIPISNGPEEFYGLPGLILEIEDEIKILKITDLFFEFNDKVKIEFPTKGEIVSREEFKRIEEKKIKELKENFKN